ncbi:hypothetical protein HMPREF0863_00286 [Erysipelotrichaceae bacterium 5_2_54FAA]|nr:hypothetical protein HMPREF0863_00286 [Erysipelotrichaceae bacterium 5_2_54FAA]
MHDVEIQIATGKSRFEKQWKNMSMSWVDFLDRLKETYKTRETMDEYLKMPKKKQDEIKDIGGFVGGTLKDGRRLDGNVLSRSLITLDVDYAPDDLWDDIDMLYGNACCLYSTHKHRKGNARYRLIIPLAKSVGPEEYEAIARKIAEDINIDYFDDTTFQASRLMYWPSTPIDGDYVFHVLDAPILDPQTILDSYQDWHDISFWPMSSRVTEIKKKAAKKQGDPLEKDGLIGAFCRTYDIHAAIETFLSDVYERCKGNGRYTYIKGSTAGGLVTYNDRFAYSNHATDPCSMQLCNAFDLVRIHKFHDLDLDVKPETPVNKLPSWVAMMDLIGQDKATLQTLGEEKLQVAMDDFKDEFEAMDTTWLARLATDKRGKYEPTTDNIVIILQNDPRLKDGIGGIDIFAQKPVKKGSLPWWRYDPHKPSWSDADDAAFRYLLEKDYGIVAKGKTDDAIMYIHEKNAFHPIREYLESVEWDGTERLDTLFIDYLGSSDTPYTRAVTRKAFTAAVARIFMPGCKYDYMPVLVGKQGIGKSHILSVMGDVWFSDSITTISGKEGYEALHGSWIVEMAELTATRKQEVESIKQFISKREDRYRKAYARRVSDNPRQCVFFGTTNDNEFLRDYTGNRRFWPVDTDADKRTKSIFHDLTCEIRDQLWAEAVMRFKSHEPLFLESKLEQEALEMQEKYTYRSSKEGLIQDYLDTKLPNGWSDMSIYERSIWLEGDHEDGKMLRDRVCVLEIWCELFNGTKSNLSNADSREINGILERLPGWSKAPNPIRINKEYGKQRAYKRDNG